MNEETKPRWSLCAITSLLAGLVGLLIGGIFPLLAIILGFVALSNIRKASITRNHMRIETLKGQKMAIAGLVMGCANGLFVFFMNNIYDEDSRATLVKFGFVVFILTILGISTKKRN